MVMLHADSHTSSQASKCGMLGAEWCMKAGP
jgi:hypothetical protein